MGLGKIAQGFLLPLIEASEIPDDKLTRLLQRNALSEIDFSQPEQWVSITRYMKLGQALIEYGNCPEIGLVAGSRSGLQGLGFVGSLVITAPTLRAALKDLVYFERLYSSCIRGQSVFRQLDLQGSLQLYSIKPYNEYNHFIVDYVLSHWYHLSVLLTGNERVVAQVEFEFPAPPYAEMYSKFFHCPVYFGRPHNRLLISNSGLDQKCLLAAPAEHQLYLELCDKALLQVGQDDSWESRTMRVLSGMLTKESAGLEGAARELRVPSWTLKRKLQEEGTSFTQVHDKTRHSLAVALLKESGHAISEIAWLTGFSSTEAFSRAFKRWTGLSPGEFRRQDEFASIRL
ncbi:AraC family transcriptional regulator [Spongorhabdus nitratireducens]